MKNNSSTQSELLAVPVADITVHITSGQNQDVTTVICFEWLSAIDIALVLCGSWLHLDSIINLSSSVE